METEWYQGGLEDALDDSGMNNNRPRKWSNGSAARPSLGSLDEMLVMGQTSGPVATLALEEKRGRRKSWHIKMERKRRKGVTGAATPPDKGVYVREKRPSWWNIFVPDHWPNRSRRASQDVSRSNENAPPYMPRSKSRSVDHGFSPPFDLDSLRNKVEGRFESVDKLGRDGDGKDGAPLAEKKISRNLPPLNTITYTVEPSDTLTSVAARFDTTPSELTKLNRMSCKLVFPGQVLYVPDKSREDPEHPGSPAHKDADQTITNERDMLDSLRPNSPHQDPLAPQPTLRSSASQVYKTSEQRFLKINVRHITDGQGVVGGVLLVTPNAVMFDPNVSDPLVIEHGPESYGVIAPMEYVVNVAIYYDIAHMRVGHSEHSYRPCCSRPDIPKPEIYRGKEPVKDSLLVKDETFPELSRNRSSEEEDNESLCSCTARDGDAFPKAFERDLVTPTNLAADTASSRQVSLDSNASSQQKSVDEKDEAKNLESFHSAEERRRSCLDHHWAVPSRDRSTSIDKDEAEAEGLLVPDKSVDLVATENSGDESDPNGLLVKHSCHDSGIDIRDAGDPAHLAAAPLHKPIAIPTKRVYSDAEIILASKSDFVPPVATTLNSSVDSMGSLEGLGLRKKTSSVSFSVDSNPDADNSGSGGEDTLHKDDQEKQESRKNKMLKRLSYPLAWMEGLTGDSKDEKDIVSSLPNHPDNQAHASMFSKVFSRRSSVGTFIRNEPRAPPAPKVTAAPKPAAPKLDYRSMVSVDDMPELFVSFDKLIPRPARSCEDPPLYLRLRMGKPINKKIPKSTPIMSYGKKKMRPEYWFSVPRNRVDDLYGLLQLWVPQLYGDLDDLDPASRGYELVESDTELWEEEGGEGGPKSADQSPEGELGELTRESWEVIKAPYVKLYSFMRTQTQFNDSDDIGSDEVLSMSEELRRALYASSAGSLDLDLFLPDLIGVTEILTEDHRKKLCRHLPARAEGYMWTLVFSTSQHGFSLNSMYRKMTRVESPILLVVEDTEHNVFGALTSCALKVSDHFYGTGESLLFKFGADIQAFNWTGDNMYFIKGNNESLAIGAGDGKFGLWLDGDLYQGRTQPCTTYGNETLAPQEDFVVKTLECWAFL